MKTGDIRALAEAKGWECMGADHYCPECQINFKKASKTLRDFLRTTDMSKLAAEVEYTPGEQSRLDAIKKKRGY